MNLLDLLAACAPSSEVFEDLATMKLVRHADNRWDLTELKAQGFFDEYQSRQSKPRFKSCTYLVSFISEWGTRCRFVGVYRILNCVEPAPAWPPGYPHAGNGLAQFYYETEKLPEFEDLEDRLIIDWGRGTRSWVQRFSPKPVIELRPVGHAKDFPGYLDFTLNFEELESIVRNRDANRTWHTMLSAVAGVYLIVDSTNGNLYVGSAYGERGILGRWSSYVRTKHGGNKELRALLEADEQRYLQFVFSILRTLPRTMTNREVIGVESLFKKKLGSRSFGLNCN